MSSKKRYNLKDVNDMVELMRISSEDARFCQELVQTNDSSIVRRLYVRAAVCYVESNVYALKNSVIDMIDCGDFQALPGEMCLLLEESYHLNEKGNIRTRPSFVSLESNIRFVFDITSRANNVEFVLDCSGLGWAAMKNAIEVRNRVTHPKSGSDFDISDTELEYVATAYDWFGRQVVELLYLINIKLKQENDAIKAQRSEAVA